ncbi:MAG: hypothetical protein JXB38_18880 [Anaerolineales bacterium]|nr:hypothetical protein [Anaerolineales bacterium]
MSQPFKLFRLQQVDSQLDKARQRIAEIEAILSDNAELQAAQDYFVEIKAARHSDERELRRAEEEVQAQQIKIEQNQAVLYSGNVKNPKELEDLQQESQSLKRFLAVLEDRQLEQMLIFEDADALYESAKAQLEAVEQNVAKENLELTQEKAGLEKDINRLEGERQAAITDVPAEDLELYAKLRKTRAGIAVAKVNNKTCSACGATLSERLAQAARSPNTIARCDTCSRIIYAG